MATSMVPVPAKAWTEVSDVTVKFQIPEQNSAYIVEAASIPSDLSIRVKAHPGKIYTFNQIGTDKLYIYSDSAIKVAKWPVA